MNFLILLLILIGLLICLSLFLLGALTLINASIKFVKWLFKSLGNEIHTFISGIKVE